MRVWEDSNGESLQITNMLEQKLARMLPKGLVIVAEQAFLNHLLFISLHQELHDLISVTHAQCLWFFERVHKVEMEGLSRVSNKCVWNRVILIVKSETPWSLLALAFKSNSSVELHTNRQVPLERLLVILKPHFLVVVDQVLRRVLVEKRFDVHQNIEQVVLARRHNLHDKKS